MLNFLLTPTWSSRVPVVPVAAIWTHSSKVHIVYYNHQRVYETYTSHSTSCYLFEWCGMPMNAFVQSKQFLYYFQLQTVGESFLDLWVQTILNTTWVLILWSPWWLHGLSRIYFGFSNWTSLTKARMALIIDPDWLYPNNCSVYIVDTLPGLESVWVHPTSFRIDY